jgi:hypothetical protein
MPHFRPLLLLLLLLLPSRPGNARQCSAAQVTPQLLLLLLLLPLPKLLLLSSPLSVSKAWSCSCST